MEKGLLKLLLAVIFVLSGAVANAGELQDVVYLNNGSIIRGTIVEQIPNKSMKVKTSDGSVFYCELSDVMKITKEEPVGGTFHRSGNYVMTRHEVTQERKTVKLDRTGYRGFADIGGGFGVGENGDGVFSISTSHGYQFNPYFFLGGGIGIDAHIGWGYVSVPIFVDSRLYFTSGKRVTPYFGVKLGFSPSEGDGLYFNPMFGVSIGLNRKLAINVSLGYNLQRADFYYIGYYGYDYYEEIDKGTIGGFMLKAGFEF